MSKTTKRRQLDTLLGCMSDMTNGLHIVTETAKAVIEVERKYYSRKKKIGSSAPLFMRYGGGNKMRPYVRLRDGFMVNL